MEVEMYGSKGIYVLPFTAYRSMSRSPRFATLLGTTLAHVQHLSDRAIAWGFRKMDAMGSKRESPEEESTGLTQRAKRGGRGILKFLGTAGRAYYEKYEKLKADAPKA